MTITNGYATLAQLKEHLLNTRVYTAVTLAFDGPTKTISDTARGLRRFRAGQRLQVTGTVSNNTFFTVVSVASTGLSLVVSETVTTEAAGASVTITDTSDVFDDAMLERAIEAASRAIDDHCDQGAGRRRFFKNGTAEARHVSPLFEDEITVDDLVSVSSLKTDDDGDGVYETTWTTADYVLQPRDAGVESPARPYRRIALSKTQSLIFPIGADTVELTGVFGWPAVPTQVTMACLLQAAHIYRRKDSPDGIAGMTDVGAVRVKTGLDGDASSLLDAFVRWG